MKIEKLKHSFLHLTYKVIDKVEYDGVYPRQNFTPWGRVSDRREWRIGYRITVPETSAHEIQDPATLSTFTRLSAMTGANCLDSCRLRNLNCSGS